MYSTAPRASIIILTHNGKPWLGQCLTAVRAQSFTDFETIIVDNGSTDGSVDDVEKNFPALAPRIERLGRNAGYAAANNHAARLARGKWLVFLNNDAYPDPNWLGALIAAAEAQPDFQFFTSRLIQANDHSRLDGAGDVYHVSGLSWRRFYNLPANEFGLTSEEVFSSCGAAAMYRRESFLDLGGFDEDWFSYNEDIDLGFRLRLRGERCLYVADAVVYHIGSASAGKKSEFAIYYGHRNLVWTYWKNLPTRLFWFYLPLHLLMNIAYVIYYSFNGRARAIWRAKIDAVRGLSKVLAKRKLQSRKISIKELESVMDRHWFSPWLRNRG